MNSFGFNSSSFDLLGTIEAVYYIDYGITTGTDVLLYSQAVLMRDEVNYAGSLK